MAVKLIVGGEYPFLDGVVNLINLWDVFAFGYGVETNLQEGQYIAGWLKFPVNPHFLDAEAMLGIVSLGFFDSFDHRLGALVLGH